MTKQRLSLRLVWNGSPEVFCSVFDKWMGKTIFIRIRVPVFEFVFLLSWFILNEEKSNCGEYHTKRLVRWLSAGIAQGVIRQYLISRWKNINYYDKYLQSNSKPNVVRLVFDLLSQTTICWFENWFLDSIHVRLRGWL